MYVSTSKNTKNGKTYITHMLRHSYREDGKVKHKNIGCLNLCSEAEIAAIKLALKHKGDLQTLTTNSRVALKQSKSFGGIFAAHSIAKSLKLDKALGNNDEGKIALLQVLARVIGQGSKLKAIRMQDSHALCEIIGLKKKIGDDKIYRNLDFISAKQQEIEKKLWQYNSSKKDSHLFLYDVTSSYLEGEENEYGAYGYNRDGKLKKKQIVIGLLTASDGMPVKVSVFDGNTSDTKTFGEQVKATAEVFGVSNVVFVGDRGMIKTPQIKELPSGCSYITAISRKEIEKLIKEERIQLGFFDTTLREVMVEETGIRYLLRCNPLRQDEIRTSRRRKIRKVLKLVHDKNEYLQQSKRAKAETAHNAIAAKITQYNLKSIIELEPLPATDEEKANLRSVKVSINRTGLSKAMELDGCYVLKSNVGKEVSKEEVHSRYKDLKFVEDGFRTMKQSHLELRPIYVRKKERTRAHVFIVMLAYMIAREMRRRLALNGDMPEILTKEVIESLNMICLQEDCGEIPTKATAGKMIYGLPKPSDLNRSYLERLELNLPEAFVVGMSVATKKSTASE